MNKFRILLVFALLAGSAVWAEGIDALLKPRLEALRARGAEPLVVCFGSFTYADNSLASEFSRYLERNLALALSACPQFELFARDKLEEILEAQELVLSDLFSQKDAVRVGRLESVKAVLAGRFFDAGKNVEVYLDLTNIETGVAAAPVKAVIPKIRIPKTVALAPKNYTTAVLTQAEIKQLAADQDRNLEIKAWTVRGDGGVFVEGEELEVHFIANRDCFVKMYLIDAQGETKLIFPNTAQSDNRVTGNSFYTVPPDSKNAWSFPIGEPYGTEFIKVVAATKQFLEIEEAFVPLGKNTRGVLTRGLPAVGKDATYKETMFSYTSVRRENKEP